MKTLGLTWWLLLLAGGVCELEAQDIAWSRVLLPIALEQPIAGAHGSVWAIEFAMLNTGQQPYSADLYTRCQFPGECPATLLQPGHTVFPSTYLLGRDSIPAHLLGIQNEGLEEVRVGLRVRDLSREDLTWGTEVPVIPETQALTETSYLLDVPVTEGFRSMLRIYDFYPVTQNGVVVRLFALDPDVRYPSDSHTDLLLGERLYEFRRVPEAEFGARHVPGYIQIPLDDLSELEGVERIRIEIAPATPGLRYWAMASVTNNETQHVTLITP